MHRIIFQSSTLKCYQKKLVTNYGVTHDSPNYILKEEVKYFEYVFCLTESNCMDFFPINNVKLTSVQKDSCEGQITEEELLDAIKAFKAVKTPGLDGIPVEVLYTKLFLIYSEDHY